MLPVLLSIPPLPGGYLAPLLVLTFLTASAVAVANVLGQRRLSVAGGAAATPETPEGPLDVALPPFVLAAGVAAGLWLWTQYPIKIHSYGFCLVIGFFAATYLACREARRRGHDPFLILDLALPLLAVSIVCCRLLFVLLNPHLFHSLREVLEIWNGGLSFHGAIVGAFATMAYFAWSRRVSLLDIGDMIAPSVFLGYAWARLGCFLNGCCYGSVCNLPWAIRFPDEHNPGQWTPPSHPVQLYSIIAALGLFAFMQHARTQPRFNRFAGQLMLMFFGLYAIERGIMEIFRNGATARTLPGLPWLTQAQLVSTLGLLAIAAFWLILARRPRPASGSLAPAD